ncbi:lysM and putative peptidoglycan-binding domain-containing protein 3 isoform X3 [Odontomachus brunneus]|uniref:lysM and putative peptidoglycan-binding domain-containing protein 3 isoform X3 n=1 Tax=Odontomachus brunneus TaxID=486640 RepID=UPI0013F2437E|nr:lysM and putative peptidoglycan-binding domain-containing protein 3 isoform X3 [Odontomachus brunneus]
MNRQGIHLRGNQKESSSHYIYLEEEDCDENNILLNVNQSTSKFRKIEVINVEVKPGDTLQALALRYSCTISALKQINKIDKENEIHAKPCIKVPVQPFSVLTETLIDKKECDNNASAQDSEEESTEDELSLKALSTNTQSSETNSLPSNRRTGIMKDIFNCSGDDCGLSWRQLFMCAFLVVFVIPIIYIYIYITRAFEPTLKKNVTTTD